MHAQHRRNATEGGCNARRKAQAARCYGMQGDAEATVRRRRPRAASAVLVLTSLSVPAAEAERVKSELAWLAARVSALAATTEAAPGMVGAGTALLSADDANGRTLTPLDGSAQLRIRLRLCAMVRTRRLYSTAIARPCLVQLCRYNKVRAQDSACARLQTDVHCAGARGVVPVSACSRTNAETADASPMCRK